MRKLVNDYLAERKFEIGVRMIDMDFLRDVIWEGRQCGRLSQGGRPVIAMLGVLLWNALVSFSLVAMAMKNRGQGRGKSD